MHKCSNIHVHQPNSRSSYDIFSVLHVPMRFGRALDAHWRRVGADPGLQRNDCRRLALRPNGRHLGPLGPLAVVRAGRLCAQSLGRRPRVAGHQVEEEPDVAGEQAVGVGQLAVVDQSPLRATILVCP